MDTTLGKLLALQGRKVALALADGGRIDDCTIVALPARAASKFWLSTGGRDIVVAARDVADVWELEAFEAQEARVVG
jgi:hypothetical protein